MQATLSGWTEIETSIPATDGMSWDEPCDDRGWLYLANDRHPDRGERHFGFLANGRPAIPCGWYLDYGPDRLRAEGENVLASAYLFRCRRDSGPCDELGKRWFPTIAEAKEWIASAVAAHLA